MRTRYLLWVCAGVVALPYVASAAHSLLSKGWSDERARSVAARIAVEAGQRDTKVNTAQQYGTGCSALKLERHFRNCFAVHVVLPKSSGSGSAEFAKERARLCAVLAQAVAASFPDGAKASLQFFEANATLLPDGTQRLNQAHIDSCSVEN